MWQSGVEIDCRFESCPEISKNHNGMESLLAITAAVFHISSPVSPPKAQS